MRGLNIGSIGLLLTLAGTGLAQNSTSTNSPTNSAAKAAEAGASLGSPTYSGTGCASSTVSAVLSPDATAMSILFDNYIVRADASTPIARKSCNIAIPINVPPGYQVRIISVDYRGFNNLPRGAESRFTVEYFLAGTSSFPYTEVFSGPLTDNYLLQDTVNTDTVHWSECGRPVNFRLNNDMTVYANYLGQEAMATVDSAEIVTNNSSGPRGMQFYFSWQPCSSFTSGAESLGGSAWMRLGAAVLLPALALLIGH